MVCGIRRIKNINTETLKNDYRVIAYELGFKHMTDSHCQCWEMGGKNESEIHTVVRGSQNNLQKQAVIRNYFLK